MKAQIWLSFSKSAPSGGNAQPWVIFFEEDAKNVVIQLGIDPQYRKQPSAMDPDGFASVIALGCLATNLTTVAAMDQFSLKDLHFDTGENHWESRVTLNFVSDLNAASPFSLSDIQNRHTNRGRYETKPILPGFLSRLKKISYQYPELKLFEYSADEKKLISPFFRLEKIRWQNAIFRKSLFKEIHFDAAKRADQSGMEIGELAISKTDAFILKNLSTQSWIGYLLGWGPDNFLAHKSVAPIFKNCSQIFFIEAQHKNFESVFNLGRCFQEFWLEATREGLAFQPFGLPLIGFSYWQNQESPIFSSSQKTRLRKITSDLEEINNLRLYNPLIGFRLGYAAPRFIRSLRKDVQAWPKKNLMKLFLKWEDKNV